MASVLVALGVFCKRCWLMFTGFATPNVVGGPGISGSHTHATGIDIWSLLGAYAPTVPEVAITVAVFALAGLAIMVLTETLVRKPAA